MYDGTVTLKSPKRRKMLTWVTRTSTNDGALITGIINEDEYDLRSLPELNGTAIDTGAHIGAVAVALGADHPKLRVIAVEPVPENMEGLRRNLEWNGIDSEVIQAAGAGPKAKTVSLRWNYRAVENADAGYVEDSRYIAGLFDTGGERHTVKAISLDALMEGMDRLALLKVDCEGCEWAFLRSPRVIDVDIIIGEFHNGGGLASLQELLPSHDVTQVRGGEDIGIFRAVRR